MAGKKAKAVFLDLLAEKVKKYRIRLFAYCLMDNHYHLILQNASGRMSDFFRNLNTQYAIHYRKVMGGKGYVFQSRFHSTIIEDDDYLKLAIIYVLQNPLQAGLVNHYREYRWSSGSSYTQEKKLTWLDADYVLELFGGSKGLDHALQGKLQKKLPILHTPFGPVLGGKSFLKQAIEKFERRHRPDAIKKRRRDDDWFDPVEKVIWEFERSHNVRIEDIDLGNHLSSRIRGELLVRLRDLAGLTFRQISEFDLFADLKYKSLAQVYKNARKRLDQNF